MVPDEGDPIQIGSGDIAVIRTPVHYNLADARDRKPQVIIQPGQKCCDLEGNSLRDVMMHGTGNWGNNLDGSTVFLVGAYEHLSDVSDRLLRGEVVKDAPGQTAVLDRLLDLLVTAVLKAWVARQDSNRPD